VQLLETVSREQNALRRKRPGSSANDSLEHIRAPQELGSATGLEAKMCNDYRLHVGAGTIADDFSNIKIKIRFPEGTPSIEPRDDIKITDTAPIVRTVDGDREAGELVQCRWSWPGQNRRKVYNFRSENREFSSGRSRRRPRLDPRLATTGRRPSRATCRCVHFRDAQQQAERQRYC
jgi:hypothetical protein